jgi:integrase
LISGRLCPGPARAGRAKAEAGRWPAQGYTAANPDGIISYTAHELRHVCASLLIASGASDVQVARQMGHAKIETTKNIYGHLFAQGQAAILDALNEAVSRLHAYEEAGDGGDEEVA